MIRKTHHVAHFQHLLDWVLGRFAGLLADDGKNFKDVSSFCSSQINPGKGLRNWVQECYGAFPVGRDHGVADAGERDPEPLLARPQFLSMPFPQIDLSQYVIGKENQAEDS